MAALGPLPDSTGKHLLSLIMPERELVPSPAISTVGAACWGRQRGVVSQRGVKDSQDPSQEICPSWCTPSPRRELRPGQRGLSFLWGVSGNQALTVHLNPKTLEPLTLTSDLVYIQDWFSGTSSQKGQSEVCPLESDTHTSPPPPCLACLSYQGRQPIRRGQTGALQGALQAS